jgi:zinc/manganese transport system substrate-binding protein/manganese/iron transport system substrate-binding protein
VPRAALRPLALALALTAALSPAAAAARRPAPRRPITVVATTTQLQDFVRNVGGARVKVVGLLRPNVDPHEYEPRPSDVAAVGSAGVVVEQGVGLDDWLDKVVRSAGRHPRIVVASRGAAILPGDGSEPQGDPHIWLDPRNAVVMVDDIAAGLAAADPADAAAFRGGARRYVARIRALDRRLARLVATVPPSRRKLVTDHDAFGYLARRYGIQVVGAIIPSLSTAAEPSARALAELIDTIRKAGVKVVFSEASVNPKLAREVASEAGARVDSSLYGDTLGPPGSPGATYLGALSYDVTAMARGFEAG